MDTPFDSAHTGAPPAGAHTKGSMWGLILLAPALLCGMVRLLVPSVQVVLYSLQDVDILAADAAKFVGFANYAFLFQNEGLGKAINYMAVQIVLRLGLVALFPLVFAWGAGRLARRGRLALRILLSVPVALFMPLAISLLAIAFFSSNGSGLLGGNPLLGDPLAVRRILWVLDGIYVLGLALGMGQIFYLPFWRKPVASLPDEQRGLHPLLIVCLVGLLATVALTLSTFVMNYVITRGGPLDSTMNLALLAYRLSFVRFHPAAGAAVATLILIPTLICGVLAGCLLVAGRLSFSLNPVRLSADATDEEIPVSPAAAMILTVLALGVCFLGAFLYGWGALQVLQSEVTRLFDQRSLMTALVNTFVSTWGAALGQGFLAYLAAIGIGALRPLGRRSEWLLLPFSPWLFATIVPLCLPFYMSMRGKLGAQTNPMMLNVPMLFILTLFFKGQSARWRASRVGDGEGIGEFMRHLIAPSLPLLGLLLLFSLFIEGQSVFWPLLIAHNPVQYPINLYLLMTFGSGYGTMPETIAAATATFALPHALFFLAGLALFQVFYLDRLCLHTAE